MLYSVNTFYQLFFKFFSNKKVRGGDIMDIKTAGRGEKMINEIGQLLVENTQIKIMKVYSGYITIISRD